MLKRIKQDFDIVPRNEYMSGGLARDWTPRSNTSVIVRVLPGYRAHFEAEFDGQGKLLSIGQWEEL
jgi:hypothetical protein